MAKNDPAKLVAMLQEKFGEKSVMLAHEMPVRPAVSSGSLALDYAIGIGGMPTDRLVEICGENGTGKTTLALMTMSNALDMNPGRFALIMDLEHKLDRDWIVQLIGEERAARTVLTWPDYAEDATNLYRAAVGGDDTTKFPPGQFCFAMFDSIGGAPTRRRGDDATKASYGGNAIAIAEFARSAAGLSHKYECLTIGINQVRADMSGYNQLVVPGGKAWLHATSLRLQVKRGKGKVVEKINGEDYQLGFEVTCKVVKSGVSAPGRVASWWFFNVPSEKYGFGVDRMEEIVRLGLLTEVIERRGSYYWHASLPPDSKGENKLLGRERLVEFLRGDLSAQGVISAEVMDRLKNGGYGAEVAPMSEDPESPLEEAGYVNLLGQSEFDDTNILRESRHDQ